MIQKSTLLHLRIPFSFFLLPVFIFALSQAQNYDGKAAFLIFIVLHLFLYPASNGYNSYFDKDEESIGGLEKPPPVNKELYFTSLIFDLVALIFSSFLGWSFVLMVFIYGLVSKAYSHPSIRLKKYPFISWLTIGAFQGYFTFMMIETGLQGLQAFTDLRLNLGGLLSSLLLLGSYPMTQVYQHNEDSKRGDKTLSLFLGIKGTFVFTAIVFSIACGCFSLFFNHFYNTELVLGFVVALFPVLAYFAYWFYRVLQNEKNTTFRFTMRLNLISSLCMNLFFATLMFYPTH